MAESIRFDFLSSGAEKLQRDFKSTGDNAAAAARGAKVLQDVIGKLGEKENRTAAESVTLAKALKLTGDAEDRMAAKAVAADAAIRRLDDAIQEEERKALEAAAANRTLGDSFGKLAEKAGGASLGGTLAALTPALIPLAGGLAAGVAAIGVSFGAAAVGAGLFGALAKTVFSNVSKDNAKLQTAQQQLAAAQIARAQATTKAQRTAADNQIAAAQDTIAAIRSEGPAYNQVLDLSKEIGAKWKTTAAQIASPVLVPWLSAVSKGIGFIRPLLQPVADLFKSWGQAVDRYFSSSAGSAEITRLATAFGRFSADQLSALGVFLTDVGKAVLNLGRDLAGHNVDFGAFSVHLDQWGGAFLRWSQSAAARQDVTKFLNWIHSNGPATAGLLKNLGGVLKAFAPGLSGAGSLELRLVSDFLGLLARTPKSIAGPLTETAGALLLLQKTGVLKVGIKIVGAAVKWLTGGVISIGSGAAAAGEIRAAFASGGAAAAAEIRAALAGGAAAGGAGGIGGGAAAGAAAGKAAGGGFLVALRAAITPAAAGVIAGALIRAAGDTLSPKGTFAGKLNKNFQDDGHLWSTTLLHSFTFGGLEAWLTAKIGLPVGKALNNVGSFIHGSWTKTENDTKSIWGNIGGFLSGSWRKMLGDSGHATTGVRNNFSGMSDTILSAMRRAGQATDAFRTRNLLPVLGTAGRVSGGIQGLQRTINLLHGKTVNVGVHGTGSGGVQVTPSSGIPGAKNFAAYFKPLAGGGRIPGFGGGDQHPALLEGGEAVVDKNRTRRYAPVLKAMGVPGMAAGGLVGAVGAIGAASAADGAAGVRADISAYVAYLKKLAAQAAVASVGSYKPGAGVKQWTGIVRQALGLAGANVAQLTDPVLYQMQTESGGNPTIVNRTDSNWLAGHPSVGLMQVINSTYRAYAGRFRNTGPFEYGVSVNPLANVYSAIKYAQANYGPGLRNAYGGIGTGHGYALGTGSAAPGWAWVGERGPELVRFRGGEQVRPAHAVPGRGGGGAAAARFEITGTGHSAFDALMVKWIQEHVRIRGGGDVQAAFGRR